MFLFILRNTLHLEIHIFKKSRNGTTGGFCNLNKKNTGTTSWSYFCRNTSFLNTLGNTPLFALAT